MNETEIRAYQWDLSRIVRRFSMDWHHYPGRTAREQQRNHADAMRVWPAHERAVRAAHHNAMC